MPFNFFPVSSTFTVILSTLTEILFFESITIGLPVAGVNYYTVSWPPLNFTLVPSMFIEIFCLVESVVSASIFIPSPAEKIYFNESLLPPVI